MKIINKFLLEYAPDHPKDVVIVSKFYPTGLKEIDIYNYYLSHKNELLKWIDGRQVAFLLKIDNSSWPWVTNNSAKKPIHQSTGKTVMIRKNKGQPIFLNSSNFEDLITGRTNVIYVTQKELTNYFVIDIDVGPNLNMKHARKTLEIILRNIKSENIDSLGTKRYEAISTSPQGIHLIGYLNHSINIDLLRTNLKVELERIVVDFNKKSQIQLTVNVKGRENNKINLDLSSMYVNSLHIAKYSLTKEFLICDDISKGLKKVKQQS